MSAADEPGRGPALCERRAWLDGHDALARADRSMELAATVVEQLAVSACMVGRLE